MALVSHLNWRGCHSFVRVVVVVGVVVVVAMVVVVVVVVDCRGPRATVETAAVEVALSRGWRAPTVLTERLV